MGGRIILKWMLGGMGRHGLDSSVRIGTIGGSFECGNEPSISIKCRKFLD
jgi:hypothetical protein